MGHRLGRQDVDRLDVVVDCRESTINEPSMDLLSIDVLPVDVPTI